MATSQQPPTNLASPAPFNVNNNSNLDLSVFKEPVNPSPSPEDDFKKSLPLQRLFASLQYYSLLNIRGDEQHQNLFQEFMDNVYKINNLLNDYHHFTKHYSDDLQNIGQYLLKEKSFKISDDIKQCQYSSRHHRIFRDGQSDGKNKLDPTLNLFCTTLDGLYYYIFRLYDVGMRVRKDTTTSTEDNDKKEPAKEDTDSVDTDKTEKAKDDIDLAEDELSKLKEAISSTRERTTSFERFPNAIRNPNTSKFSVSIHDKSKDALTIFEGPPGTTYLDAIYDHLKEQNIDEETIQKLSDYIINEGFCTDSVDYDVNSETDGNIAKHVKRKKSIQQIMKDNMAHRDTYKRAKHGEKAKPAKKKTCIQHIIDYISASRRMSSTLSL